MQKERAIIRDLKVQRKELESQLAKVNKAIAALEPVQLHTIGWKDKALECLQDFNCYTQTVDILNCVFYDKMEELENEVNRKRYITALSVALLDMVKTGELKMFKIPKVKGSFYGFPQWFDDNGNVKKKYYSKKMKNMNKDINDYLNEDKVA